MFQSKLCKPKALVLVVEVYNNLLVLLTRYRPLLSTYSPTAFSVVCDKKFSQNTMTGLGEGTCGQTCLAVFRLFHVQGYS